MPATWQPRTEAESLHIISLTHSYGKENRREHCRRTVGFLQKLSTIDDVTKYRGIMVFLRLYIIVGHFLISRIPNICSSPPLLYTVSTSLFTDCIRSAMSRPEWRPSPSQNSQNMLHNHAHLLIWVGASPAYFIISDRSRLRPPCTLSWVEFSD